MLFEVCHHTNISEKYKHIDILSRRASLNRKKFANPFKTPLKSSYFLGIETHDFLNKTNLNTFGILNTR